MSGHPDDEAFLDSLPFTVSPMRGHCDRCSHAGPTTAIGFIETGSGGGYDLRHCRACVGIYLARARSLAGEDGAYRPGLPQW